ncbi:MAG: glutathione S-transferase family protein [Bauldia sp.]|nr:glutathione S-transferase family protein [Bauldia sp.]
MAEFELTCFDRSGNSYKAALMLELTGCDWAPRGVDYFNGETRTEDYRAFNVMGEAPVLFHGDTVLSQSGVILDYLAEITGRFGPESPAERREIWRWILFDNHKLTSYTATLRAMRSLLKTGETPVTEFLDKRARGAWDVLDRQLRTRDFVIGDRPTIADLSLCGYLFYDGEIGIEIADFPAMAAWRERIRALPGWKHPYDLMPVAPLPETA